MGRQKELTKKKPAPKRKPKVQKPEIKEVQIQEEIQPIVTQSVDEPQIINGLVLVEATEKAVYMKIGKRYRVTIGQAKRLQQDGKVIYCK